jgi:DNA polymerase
MGVKISETQAQDAVTNYRKSYSKVKELWGACEKAAISAVETTNVTFKVGDKLQMWCRNRALWLKLPSGRVICWQRPQLELLTTPWGDQKMGVTVHSQNTYTRQWARNQLIGSSIFQSAVQGTARDFLASAMLSLEAAGYEVINSIHDEVLLLVEEQNGESAMDDVIKIMTTPPSWATDFPLAAEGWVSKRYKK